MKDAFYITQMSVHFCDTLQCNITNVISIEDGNHFFILIC